MIRLTHNYKIDRTPVDRSISFSFLNSTYFFNVIIYMPILFILPILGGHLPTRYILISDESEALIIPEDVARLLGTHLLQWRKTIYRI